MGRSISCKTSFSTVSILIGKLGLIYNKVFGTYKKGADGLLTHSIRSCVVPPNL